MASIKFETQSTKSFNSKSICGFASKLSDRKLKLHNIKSRKYNYKNKQQNKHNIHKKEYFKRSILRKQDRMFKETLLQFTDNFEHQNINENETYSSDEFDYYYNTFDDCSSISSDATTVAYSHYQPTSLMLDDDMDVY